MHIEIGIALNFVMNQLYNKLPRRRIHLFGEELDKALKSKFANHWYPDRPMKGSAYRCIKTGQPTDTVFVLAASEANVPIGDIIENLPSEMSIWIDPGEVSYRIGEKSSIKVLWSKDMRNLGNLGDMANMAHQNHLTGGALMSPNNSGITNGMSTSPTGNHGGALNGHGSIGDAMNSSMNSLNLSGGGQISLHALHQQQQNHHHQQNTSNMLMDDLAADREVNSSFNPDAQVFQPISTQSMNATTNGGSSNGSIDSRSNKSVSPPFNPSPNTTNNSTASFSLFGGPSNGIVNGVVKNPVGNGTNLMTTAAFAQTKFGSTKLKTSSKRTHRMSPTEFSNYIKQRAIAQQAQQQQQQQNQGYMTHHSHMNPHNIIGGQQGNLYPNVFMGGNNTSNSSSNNSSNMIIQNSQRPRSITPPDFFNSYEKYNPFESQIWSNNNGLGKNNSLIDFSSMSQQSTQNQQQQLVA